MKKQYKKSIKLNTLELGKKRRNCTHATDDADNESSSKHLLRAHCAQELGTFICEVGIVIVTPIFLGDGTQRFSLLLKATGLFNKTVL